MARHIDARRSWLFVLSGFELQRYFLSEGRSFFEGNGLQQEGRLLREEARVERLCAQQLELASGWAEARERWAGADASEGPA